MLIVGKSSKLIHILINFILFIENYLNVKYVQISYSSIAVRTAWRFDAKCSESEMVHFYPNWPIADMILYCFA